MANGNLSKHFSFKSFSLLLQRGGGHLGVQGSVFVRLCKVCGMGDQVEQGKKKRTQINLIDK